MNENSLTTIMMCNWWSRTIGQLLDHRAEELWRIQLLNELTEHGKISKLT